MTCSHHLRSADLTVDIASDSQTLPYKLIRAIYDISYPDHLARIKLALDRLRGLALEPFTSELGFDDESQASDASSQEQGQSRRSHNLFGGLAVMQQQLAQPRERWSSSSMNKSKA